MAASRVGAESGVLLTLAAPVLPNVHVTPPILSITVLRQRAQQDVSHLY
ncbi:MAG TPA: hypothetical protein VEK33_19580 [Terriglobales bacterium]|nr:hypothetical protein [Terriglobales bacterium]